MRFLKLRYFYIIVLVLLVISYVFPSTFYIQKQKEWLDIYFGNLIYLALFVLFLYGVRMWQESVAEKIVFEIRLYLGLFSFFAFLAIFFLWSSGVSFQTFEISSKMKDVVLSRMIYDFHSGLLAGYAMYLLLNLKISPFYHVMYGILAMAVIFLFLVIYKPMKKRYCHWRQVKREKIQREREERAIQEQIKIKKALEREEARKVAQFAQRKIELIQERARGFEMGQLMSSVELDEEEDEEETESSLLVTEEERKQEEEEEAPEKEMEVGSIISEEMEKQEEEQEFEVEIFAEELENKR
ncbi:MAG TPA: hypothetical protein VIG61_00445 [Fusobacterium sp.]|uniref:hypothetical protein n=1 Tax=Fusobacterium sp. TaxID=68766 RepID=UPI002F40B001